ncbi:MAG: Holliday junction resolvase RecU [Lachnospiraceae bacterium]|nr:Holliday junction resolvase RecU [Lachnospiraceae bacterium]
MPTWKSRGLRGSVLEDIINRTNEKYTSNHLALIQKIPTPITPINMDHSTKQITLAYFEKKSTVDYIGAAQGLPVCFDAKECAADSFSLKNIHEHQVEFMKEFEKQGGISFFLIYFTNRELYYYLRLSEFLIFYERAIDGGRKSFRIDELCEDFFIENVKPIFIPYLDYINKDIRYRENNLT